MLTVDHVRCRRRAGELTLTRLSDASRMDALRYASAYLAAAQGAVGQPRSELVQRWDDVPVAGKDRKLALGLRKLTEDLCEFEAKPALEPLALREAAFLAATEARQTGEDFDRDAIVLRVAEALGIDAEAFENAMYADLKEAHRLLNMEPLSPEAMLDRYELGQAQAVLLRAKRLVIRVADSRADGYRKLFRAIKFRRLLVEVHPEGDGYRIELDGPMSLFSSATKYGLALALLLPVIRSMERWSLMADLQWGKTRDALRFKLAGRQEGAETEAPLPMELEQLLEKWPALNSPFKLSPRAELMNVPGAGVVIPDVAFHNEETGEVLYLELLGYWSRDAVFRRLELVEAGLREKILFVCSQKLRVSEAVFGDDLPSRLLVYKNTLSPKAVLKKLKELSGDG